MWEGGQLLDVTEVYKPNGQEFWWQLETVEAVTKQFILEQARESALCTHDRL